MIRVSCLRLLARYLLLASVVLDKVLFLVDLRLETHDTILLSDSNFIRIGFTRDRHLMIQVTQRNKTLVSTCVGVLKNYI